MIASMKSATIWKRFMAMVYESILLLGPIFFSILVCSILSSVVVVNNEEGRLSPIFVQGLVLFITASYFSWGWSNNRVTLPMKTLGLRVVDLDGNSISGKTALFRFFISLPIVLSGAWLAFAFFKKNRPCLHDLISKTRLIEFVNE